MQIKKLNSDDLPLLAALQILYEDTFELKGEAPSLEHLEELLGKKDMVFFVALDNQEVIGGLTTHVLSNIHFGEPEGYIYDIAVNPLHQRKGVGAALLMAIVKYGSGNGWKEVFVQADKTDRHAVDFYRKAGGIELDTFHYSFKCK